MQPPTWAGVQPFDHVVAVLRRIGGRLAARSTASYSGRPDVAPPETLRGYIDNLARHYTAGNIVVSVQTPDEGVALHGRLIPNLPASAVDTLRPANQTRRAEAYRLAERTVAKSATLVIGRQELTIPVRPERDDVLGRGP